MADSSTEAMPWTMSPSPGIDSPADTTTTSPSRRSPDETSVIGVRSAAASATSSYLVTRCAIVDVRVCRRVSACALPRPSATDSARFAKSTVSQSQTAMAQVKEAGTSVPPETPGAAEERLGDREHRGERGADLDDEHDGVVPHLARIELAERAGQRLRRAAPGRSRRVGRFDGEPIGRGVWPVSLGDGAWTWISSALPPGDPA